MLYKLLRTALFDQSIDLIWVEEVLDVHISSTSPAKSLYISLQLHLQKPDAFVSGVDCPRLVQFFISALISLISTPLLLTRSP